MYGLSVCDVVSDFGLWDCVVTWGWQVRVVWG